MATRRRVAQTSSSSCVPVPTRQRLHNQHGCVIKFSHNNHRKLSGAPTAFSTTSSNFTPPTPLPIPTKPKPHSPTSHPTASNPLSHSSTAPTGHGRSGSLPRLAANNGRPGYPAKLAANNGRPRSSAKLAANNGRPGSSAKLAANNGRPGSPAKLAANNGRPGSSAKLAANNGRPGSSPKLAADNGRCQVGHSKSNRALEDGSSDGTVKAGSAASAAGDDRLGTSFPKHTETSKVPARQPKSVSASRRKSILRQLNLDDFPSYWYTTVIPASDVYIQRPNSFVRAQNSGLRFTRRPQTVPLRLTSSERYLPATSLSHLARPQTSRLLCAASPAETLQPSLRDLSATSSQLPHDILYATTLQRHKETCRRLEESLHAKVRHFLASLDVALKSQVTDISVS